MIGAAVVQRANAYELVYPVVTEVTEVHELLSLLNSSAAELMTKVLTTGIAYEVVCAIVVVIPTGKRVGMFTPVQISRLHDSIE